MIRQETIIKWMILKTALSLFLDTIDYVQRALNLESRSPTASNRVRSGLEISGHSNANIVWTVRALFN